MSGYERLQKDSGNILSSGAATFHFALPENQWHAMAAAMQAGCQHLQGDFHKALLFYALTNVLI